MELNTMPLDGLRPVLSYLDLESLIKLYATFDRKLQTLLSSPNAFAYLCIEVAGKGIPVAPYRYFITAVRSVTYLKFENDVCWSPSSVGLLQALNPRKLVIGARFLHSSVQKMLIDANRYPQNQELGRLASFFSFGGIPNFSVLTPRLETLKLAYDSFGTPRGTFGFRVPPTLTNLKVPFFLPLDAVPSTLLALEIFSLLKQFGPSTTAGCDIFSLFPSLQRLTFDGIEFAPSEIPSTLQSLNLVGNGDLSESAHFLTHPGLRQFSLTSIVISDKTTLFFSDPIDLDLAQLLPPTLLKLHLPMNFDSPMQTEDGVFIRSLPPSLTDLSINSSLVRDASLECKQSLPRLINLPKLEHLELTSNVRPRPCVALSSYGELPSNIKTLNLLSEHIEQLTLSEIQRLPQSLKSLKVTSFNLELLDVFSWHLPACHLHIASPCRPWNIPEHVLESSQNWLPHLDICKVAAHTEAHYRQLGVALTLNIDAELSLLPSGTDNNPRAQRFNSELKSIVLPANVLTCNLKSYPPGLTSIIAPPITKCSLNFASFPYLLHFDSPSTSISFYDVYTHLANLTTLKAIVTSIEDYNVVPFLTRFLSPKARLNSSIAIETVATGVLLPDNDVSGMKDVTWPTIQVESETILKRLLASTMPVIDSNCSETNDMVTNDTIGRIVVSLKLIEGEPFETATICIPPSATKARINGKDRCFAAKWTKLPSTRPDGLLLRQSALDDDSSIGPLALPIRLVHLELRGIDTWWKSDMLPESLRFLSISKISGSVDILNWPSKLEVLIWWTDEGFNATLPPSLLHLAVWESFSLKGCPPLPLLKTVSLREIYSVTELLKLPVKLKQLEKCIVCHGYQDSDGDCESIDTESEDDDHVPDLDDEGSDDEDSADDDSNERSADGSKHAEVDEEALLRDGDLDLDDYNAFARLFPQVEFTDRAYSGVVSDLTRRYYSSEPLQRQKRV